MSQDLYQEIILEEFRNPQNQGQLQGAHIFSHHDRNASCGDEVTVYLQIDPQTQKIQQLKWQGQGCAISMAAMSLLSQYCLGKMVSELKNFDKKDVEKLLGLDEVVSGREKCLLLGLQAIRKALSTFSADSQESLLKSV